MQRAVALLIAMLGLIAAPAFAQAPPSAFGGAEPQRPAPPPAFAPPPAAAPQETQSQGTQSRGTQSQRTEPQAVAPQAAAPREAPGFFGRLMTQVTVLQQQMQRQLAGAVKRMKDGNALAALLFLAGLSFVYGVVHAAGPGHGKAIISSYVVANEETVRRGVLVSFLAAGVQGLTAVALVGVLVIALDATGFEAKAWVGHLETLSYALVFLVGLYLLVSEVLRLWRRRQAASHAHDHAHHHHHHDHDHDHEDCEACAHMVDPSELTGPVSWRKLAAVVLSVGIRPCSGAVLVLIFALAQGLFWAGVAATFAMALGTAITVSVLATMALGTRKLALVVGGDNARWVEGVWTVCAIGGALLVMAIGGLLFAASLGPARPF